MIGGFNSPPFTNGARMKAEYEIKIIDDGADILENNMRSCLKRKVKELQGHLPVKLGKIAICAGGVSLRDNLDKLREFDGYIMALNGTGKYLRENGIKPDGIVLLDSADMMLQFIQKPSRKIDYWIASRCSPLVFDKLKGQNVIVWHADNDTYRPEGKHYIGGGCSVGTRSICLALSLGFRDIELFGMDMCIRKGQDRAYTQKGGENPKTMNVFCGIKEFTCAPYMAEEAKIFRKIMTNYGYLFDMKVHGDGLLATFMKEATKLTEQKNGL